MEIASATPRAKALFVTARASRNGLLCFNNNKLLSRIYDTYDNKIDPFTGINFTKGRSRGRGY
jgi:hypothetical protein